MGCSVKTGSAGSAGSLRKTTKPLNVGYGGGRFKFTDLFPDITPLYVGLDSVTAGSSATGAASAPTISVKENEIEAIVGGGGAYINATVFALY